MAKKILFSWMFWAWLCSMTLAQNEYLDKNYQFTAYDCIPTWKAVVSAMDKSEAQVHLFDIKKYKGHGNYVSSGMKTGLKFAQFKELVRHPGKRKYLPIFIYDLSKKPLYIEGMPYKWAVRLEHYDYTDNEASMRQTLLRMMRAVEQKLNRYAPGLGKGIIILATEAAPLPNMTARTALADAGYPSITLKAMINRVNELEGPRTSSASSAHNTVPSPIKILNAGTAVGYFKVIKAGEEEKVNSNVKNILFYENIPYRVPIANGIITAQPQTPLSHVNLLAKNRGTINAYCLGDVDINRWKELYEGKLVKIVCAKQGVAATFSIRKVSLSEAKAHWTKQKTLRVDIPQPDLSLRAFSHFKTGSTTVQTVDCIGAKATNYARLQHVIPNLVRPGFAIPFYWYFETIKSCKADRLIEALLKEKDKLSQAAIYQKLAAIRAKILAGKVDDYVFTELDLITAQYFKGKKVRLRSSTNCEDLPQFNGAGLYESKGFLEGSERAIIEKKLLKVYASLWLDRAFDEREFFGIDHKKAGMAVLINGAFPDEYANGVALTIPNEKGSPTIHINTQYGELSVTNPENGAVPEAIYFRAFDSKWYVTESKSSVHNIFIENAKLTPLVRQLQDAMATIDGLLRANIARPENYGVDVEFKIMKEGNAFKLYIKQGRLLNMVLPQ